MKNTLLLSLATGVALTASASADRQYKIHTVFDSDGFSPPAASSSEIGGFRFGPTVRGFGRRERNNGTFTNARRLTIRFDGQFQDSVTTNRFFFRRGLRVEGTASTATGLSVNFSPQSPYLSNIQGPNVVALFDLRRFTSRPINRTIGDAYLFFEGFGSGR